MLASTLQEVLRNVKQLEHGVSGVARDVSVVAETHLPEVLAAVAPSLQDDVVQVKSPRPFIWTREQQLRLLHDIENRSVSRRLRQLGQYYRQDTPRADLLSWLDDGWEFAEEQSAARGERRFFLSQVRFAAARCIGWRHR